MTTKAKPNGAILYQGPSKLDGAPIVVIVTGLASSSANTKTGDMLQTWILRQDVAPNVAIKTGQDSAICGSCTHRGEWSATTGKWTKKRTCYVKTFQGPLAVYKAWKRGNYPHADTFMQRQALGASRVVRIGSYGDPMAVPYNIWSAFTSRADAWTGYTQQWANIASDADITRAAWSRLVMASADSQSEAAAAHANGWRTFRVMPKGEQPTKAAEVLCPASKEAGAKTVCAKCQLCKGTASKSTKSIAINIH